MKSSSLRSLNLLISLFLLIATILVYSLLVKPEYEAVNVLRGDLSSKSAALEEQKKIVSKAKQMIGDFQGLGGAKQAISLVLPPKEEYPALINQLSGLSRAAGIILDSVDLSPLPFSNTSPIGEGAPKVSIIQATLNIRGSYQSLKNFIETVESNVRVMDVIKISIAPNSQGGEVFSYSVVVNVYYQSL